MTRWRGGAAAAVIASALLVLSTVRWASVRAERALAQRVAATAAAYLAFVAPPARGSADYDLPRLLIETRALDGLPGFTTEVEVYHGTAPLVHATARPLSPSQFDQLRRHAAARWAGAATLAPLFDRDGWDVVGVVAAWPARGGWLSWWTALAVLLSLVAWLTSNLGGFVIGLLLGVIGGSLSFGWAPGPRRSRQPRGGAAPER